MTTSPPDEFAIVVVAVELEVLVRANDVPNINDETVKQIVPHGTISKTRILRVIPILEANATDVSYHSGGAT